MGIMTDAALTFLNLDRVGKFGRGNLRLHVGVTAQAQLSFSPCKQKFLIRGVGVVAGETFPFPHRGMDMFLLKLQGLLSVAFVAEFRSLRDHLFGGSLPPFMALITSPSFKGVVCVLGKYPLGI